MLKIYSSYFIIAALHLSLVQYHILPGKLSSMFISDAVILILFILGFLIAVPALKKDGETFSLRFLIMTTVQMLLMLFMTVVLVFAKINDFKSIGFSAISLFIIFLIIQSVYLVRKTRNSF